MDIVETKTLFFKEGSSDKFYTATIDEIEGGVPSFICVRPTRCVWPGRVRYSSCK